MSPTRTSVTRIAVALALLLGLVMFAVPALASTTVNGTLSNFDSSRTTRLVLNNTASSCAGAKAFPGQEPSTGTRRYESYTITNTTGSTRCVTVSLSGGSNQRPITSFAYLNAVPDTLVATNYLGDLGSSLNGGNGSYAFNLGNNQTAVIVVVDRDTNENQSTDYTITYGASLPQTITFNNPGPRTFGDAPFALGGTASSGLAVSYTTTTPAVCTVSGSTLTIAGAGSCTVNANQAGNTFYAAAPQVQQSFTVARAGQSISFGALGDRTYGDAGFTVSATGGASGLPVVFSSATPAVCAVSGSTVSILAAGGCTVNANQAGNANYDPAPQVQQSFTVVKKTLTAVASDETRRVGQPNPGFTILYDGFVGADDESVLDVKPTATTSADESSAPGSYPIVVSGGSDDNYTIVAGSPAGTLTVTAKEIPVISWSAPAAIGYGTPLSAAQLNATVSNGGDPLGTLSYSPDLGTVLDAGNGQVLSVTYTPADTAGFETVSAQVQINVLAADQTIAFEAIEDRTYGDADFAVSVTGGASGNPVNLSAAGACALSGTTVSITGAGACTITAAQDGSANYNPAAPVQRSFTIAKKALTATALDAIRTVGKPNPAFTVELSGFVPGEDASVVDAFPTASTTADAASPAGTYAITVSGGSDNNYTFTYVDGTLTVTTKDIPTITWVAPAGITYGTPLGAAQLSATASFDGQPVAGTFVYTPAAGTVLGAGSGRVLSVTFTPADGASFESATRQVTINVAQAPLTISADDKTMVAGTPVPALTASYSGFVAGDGAGDLDTPVTLTTAATSSSPAGTYEIVASGAADANYAITFVKGTLTVSAAPVSAPFTTYLPFVRR